MSITNTTTTAIVCDKCGRTIAVGETWAQVGVQVTSDTFTGAIAGMTPVSTYLMQLCADDYKAVAPTLAQLAPLAAADPPLASGPAVATVV